MFLTNYFGLNLNLLETNLFNIIILLGLIIYVARGFIQGSVESRRLQIMKTLDSLNIDLLAANQRFKESNKQLKQMNLVIIALQKEHLEQKQKMLDKKYDSLIGDLIRLFNLSYFVVENTTQDTFLFLQKYLITLVIGKLIIKFTKCESTPDSELKFDQTNLLDLALKEVILN